LLDTLGFDVTGGSPDEAARRLQRATAVVQLDAGLPMTGQPDDAVRRYLGLVTDPGPTARETRQIGMSAQGRPITAIRYGDGPRTVLVVGQTTVTKRWVARPLASAVSPRFRTGSHCGSSPP
jgi:hypothetical protein